MSLKRCSCCGEEKDLSEFYLKLGKPIAHCKPCHRAKINGASKERKRLKRQKEQAKGLRNKGSRQAALEALKNWKAANPGRVRNLRKTYKLRVQRQCPAWADRFAIDAMYEIAARLRQETGLDWHVDHIIPLKGEIVSGLHVHTNLQIMLGADNMSKGNRFDL